MTRRSVPVAVSRPWRRTLAALAAALLGAPLSAQTPSQPAGALTLDAAIAMALANNKTIAAARLQRPVDLAGVGVAGERPNPDLTFEGAKDTPRKAIGLSLPIELGGKRGARLGVARAAVAAGEAQLDQLVASTRNEVRRAYFELVAARSRVGVAQEVLGLVTRARDAANARLLAGDVPRRDAIAAQADLLDAENDVTAARGEVEAARATLNVLLGQPPGAALDLADTLDPVPVPTLEDALARAAQVNGELIVLDRRIAEQMARVALAKALQKPDVIAGGGVTWDAQPDFRIGWRVNFGVTLPLFTRHRAGVALEDAELVHLRAERDAVLADVTGAIAAALAKAGAAVVQLTAYQRDLLPLTRQDEAMAQDAYTAGQSGLDALILALQRARERRLKGIQAGLEFHVALADLERAVGGSLR